MSGPDQGWLLLHGTPLTPRVWDGVAEYLRGYGPVWCPDVSPVAGVRDTQAALAGHLACALERFPERLHVAGHSFGGQVAIDFALLAPRRVRTLTVVCSRDTPFPAFAAAAARLRDGTAVDAGAELDPVSAPAAMSALASRLPRASMHVLAGAAHMTPFSDPARLGMFLVRAARS